MKNTLQRAKFRIIIYKNRNSKEYHSLCYETNQINEKLSFELIKKSIIFNLIEKIKFTKLRCFFCKNEHSEELNIINQQPSFKNRIIFYFYPILSILFFRCFYCYQFSLDLENGYLTESLGLETYEI